MLPAESRKALDTDARRAIAERQRLHPRCRDHHLCGRSRWIRITATVECEDGVPVRISA
ncbi:hypothetical protein ACFSQT_16110 [Mesorhizobium calcicola]|uniref:Uncharacterized protein n=1 Tax=Mesorhizobium calcicola TaxID=1300310 RepID=A0ABW4WFB7_9HYPH